MNPASGTANTRPLKVTIKESSYARERDLTQYGGVVFFLLKI